MFSCSVIIGRSASVQCKVLGLVSLSENPTAQIQIYAFFIFFLFLLLDVRKVFDATCNLFCGGDLVSPLWNLEDVWFVHAA